MTKQILAKDALNCIVWRWPNFPPSEVACKQVSKKGRCGCGGTLLNDPVMFDTLDRLQTLRNMVKVPVIVNSFYRCLVHNRNVGGAVGSQHPKARAVDIRITPTLSRAAIHQAAKIVGFTGFGDYDSFVHVDTGPARYWDERTKK